MAKKDSQKPEKTKPQKEKKAKAPKENKKGKNGCRRVISRKHDQLAARASY